MNLLVLIAGDIAVLHRERHISTSAINIGGGCQVGSKTTKVTTEVGGVQQNIGIGCRLTQITMVLVLIAGDITVLVGGEHVVTLVIEIENGRHHDGQETTKVTTDGSTFLSKIYFLQDILDLLFMEVELYFHSQSVQISRS